MHWLRYSTRGRSVAAVGLMVVVFFVTVSWVDWDSAFLLAWDAGVLCWLAFTFAFMARASAAATAVSAQRADPSAAWMLVVVTMTAAFGSTLISFAFVVVLLGFSGNAISSLL